MQKLFLFTLVFSILSCNKKSADLTTTVQIKMPDLSGLNSTSSEIASEKTLEKNRLQQKSLVANPTSISEINCFALLVSGPENFLNRTTCPIVNEAKTILSNLSVGQYRGLVPTGQTLSLKVSAGSQRKFTLIGLKATPLTSCKDFFDPDANIDFTSDSFVIGESALINLQPGSEVSVPITIASSSTILTSASPRIGDCVGPDAPINFNKVIPTQAVITKNFFPFQSFLENSCNPLDIEFMNTAGQRGAATVSATVAILMATNGSSNFSTFNYYQDINCSVSSTDSGSVATLAGQKVKRIYFSTALTSAVSSYSFKLQNSANIYPDFSTVAWTNKTNTTYNFDIIGATRVLPDTCYNMVGTFRDFASLPTSGTGYSVFLPDIQAKIYSNKNCGDANSLSMEIPSGGSVTGLFNGANFDFSVRFTQTPFSATYFTLMSPEVSGVIYSENSLFPVEVIGGSNNPTNISVAMPAQLPAINSRCYGPFAAIIENERGSAIPVVNSTLSVSFAGAVSPSILGLKSSSDCTQNYSSTIFGQDYKNIFYISVGTGFSTGTPYTLLISGDIENPDTSLNDNPVHVTLTTSRTLTLQ